MNRPYVPVVAPPSQLEATTCGFDGVQLTPASDVQSESIHWLWRGWIARRKLHILAGHPGEGKTTIALDLAAKITTGKPMPDGSAAPVGSVLFYTAEDGLADTIKPRFEAAGGDTSRLMFVTATYDRGKARDFDPVHDLLDLQRAIEQQGDVALVVIDPVVAVLAGEGHNNAEVRRSLKPLVNLAEHCNCAVIGITHFNKGDLPPVDVPIKVGSPGSRLLDGCLG